MFIKDTTACLNQELNVEHENYDTTLDEEKRFYLFFIKIEMLTISSLPPPTPYVSLNETLDLNMVIPFRNTISSG